VKLSFNREKPRNSDTAKSEIVFIHGTGSNSQMWQNQVPFFVEQGYPCTLLDLRGHGGTPEPREKTSLRVHADDVVETLSHAEVRLPAYFVGHSLGAIISVFLACEKPELFKSIFAVSLPGTVSPAVVQAFRVFLSGPLQSIRKSGLHKHLAWRERTLFEMDKFTLSEIADEFGSMDLRSSVADLKCPVHFAVGRFDPVASCAEVQKMQAGLKGSSLEIFEWAGHNFMDASAKEFNNWLFKHIAGQVGAFKPADKKDAFAS
jgi:pimeloyl-ACP methyl ester carboxylesterase